ncbi:MAG: hypothetical protein M3Y59_12355 [Myxococcota bacterium]|nr:hypothetical protein [Myxococcota bacterium]
MESDERIIALERQLSVLRRRGKLTLGLAVLGIAVAVLAMASRALPVRELKTSRLTLVDGLGRTRATLATEEEGPRLVLFAADEAPRATLGLSGQQGSLAFTDAEGGQRLLLSGKPGLMLSDASRARLALEVGSEGPAMELIDAAGYATFHPVDGFKFYGAGGALAAALQPGALSLYAPSAGPDSRLAISLSAPQRPGERVRLLLYDEGETPSFVAP